MTDEQSVVTTETNEEPLETTPVETEETTTQKTTPEAEPKPFFEHGQRKFQSPEELAKELDVHESRFTEASRTIRERSLENRRKDEELRQKEAEIARLRNETSRETTAKTAAPITVEQASAKVDAARDLIKNLKFDPSGDYEGYQTRFKAAQEALADATSDFNQAILRDRSEAKQRAEVDAATRANNAKIETYRTYAEQNPELYQITDDIYVVSADPQHPQHKNLLNSEKFMELLDRGFSPEDAHLFVTAKSGHVGKPPEEPPANNKPKATSPEQKVYKDLSRSRGTIRATTVEADAQPKKEAKDFHESLALAREEVRNSTD